MRSSESPSSFSSFSSSSSSSLNTSAVESFHFSPCHDHLCCMEDPSGEYKVSLQHERGNCGQSEILSSEESDGRCQQKQTLAQLLSFHNCPSEKEEEELLLSKMNGSQQQHKSPKPPKSLLVQALCGGRKTTPTVTSARISTPALVNPQLQRSTGGSRRRYNAPSPLRNSSDNPPGSACCGGSNVVDCMVVVRSKSAGNVNGKHPHGLPQEFLTKSKSTGSAAPVHGNQRGNISPSPRDGNSATKMSLINRNCTDGKPLSGSGRRSTSTYSWSTSFQSRSSSSGRPSFTYKSSSVNSSSSASLQTAINRYQQHRNSEAEHKRRSSFLPYRSALLSLFFPLPSFWTHQPVPHYNLRST